MFTVLSAEAFNVVDTFETALDSIQTSFNGMVLRSRSDLASLPL